MRGRRLLPSPSMAVALLALVLAGSGVSYAAVKLGRNAVKRTNIANNAVNGSKVANDSLTGDDVKESTLEGLTADGLAKVTYKTATATAPPAASIDSPGVGTASATCDPGTKAIAGGVRLEAPQLGEQADGFPDAGGSVWTVHVANGDTNGAHNFTAYAICVPIAETG
jgi:hypothetical protein